MTFKIATYDPVTNTIPMWWSKFYNIMEARGGSVFDNYHDELAKHNAIHTEGYGYIEFETEEDFVVFKLKFS